MSDEKLIGPRDAALILGVHENTVRNWAAAAQLKPAQTLKSGYRRFKQSDIETFADSLYNPETLDDTVRCVETVIKDKVKGAKVSRDETQCPHPAKPGQIQCGAHLAAAHRRADAARGQSKEAKASPAYQTATEACAELDRHNIVATPVIGEDGTYTGGITIPHPDMVEKLISLTTKPKTPTGHKSVPMGEAAPPR